ncbi:unnamed protein product [Peniophora sp. CBMAI 1063]|nr:unnamed protein product [Peniophora sp. CBMAI 1063]
MDLREELPSAILVVEAAHNADALDILAVGTSDAVYVIQATPNHLNRLATFHLGAQVCAIAFSPRTVSPSVSSEPILELVCATSDFGLHVLSKEGSEESIFDFGGGLTGHHAAISALTFCGGAGSYVASASADHMLIIWDLSPQLDIPSTFSTSPSPGPMRKQPTAYPIPFPHPLTSLSAHPRSDKDLLISDARGTLYLLDWRSERGATDTILSRRATLSLTHPRALASPDAHSAGGSAAWARDNMDLITAAYGGSFAVWDVRELKGGRPVWVGEGCKGGVRRIRFASGAIPFIALVPLRTPAELHIHSAAFPGAAPAVLTLGRAPLRVADFDFVDEMRADADMADGEERRSVDVASGRGPRVAAAVGRSLLVFWVGEE